MNEKPVGGFLTGALVAPLMVVCCLGPVVVGAFGGGLIAWLGRLGPGEVAGAALVAGLLAYGLHRWRKSRLRRTGAPQQCETSAPVCASDDRALGAEPNLSTAFRPRRDAERAPTSQGHNRLRNRAS